MAPIKFEEHIREKLQERELSPSKEAWEKLAQSLGDDVPQKKNPAFLWMAIAATVVGILLMVVVFTNTTETAIEENLVEEETIEILDQITPKTIESVISSEEKDVITSSETLENKKTNLITKNSVNENKIKVVTSKIQVHSLEKNNDNINTTTLVTTMQEASTTKQQNSTKERTAQQQPFQDTFINNKVEEVVAKVQQSNTITSTEIDALLAKAQRDIATHRIATSSHQKVDAMALLNDVETSLEQSFRDKYLKPWGMVLTK